MKIEYERTASHSYLVMAEAEYPYAVYEWEMLQNNEIRGLIPFRPISENGKKKYWYDITGLQAMEIVLQNGPVRADLVKRMICSLAELKLTLENYMLEERAVCFRPELIFFDRRSKDMRFCLIPGYQKENAEGMAPLLELLLNHLDHSDQAGVRMAYQLYELCADGSCGREELLGCIRGCGAAAEEQKENRKTDRYRTVFREKEPVPSFREKEQIPSGSGEYMDTDLGKGESQRKKRRYRASGQTERQDQIRKSGITGQEERRDRITGSGIAERIRRIRQRETSEPQKTEKRGQKADKRGSRRERRGRFVSEEKAPVYGSGPADGFFGTVYGMYESSAEGDCGSFPMAEEKPFSEEAVTELVQQPEHNREIRLIYRGNGEEQDLCVDHFPYLIGKRVGGADGILQAETVSRVHARIILDPEQGICVQDMNSTNGTRLNGDLIPFHTPVPVKKNDRLMFGTEVFVMKGEL